MNDADGMPVRNWCGKVLPNRVLNRICEARGSENARLPYEPALALRLLLTSDCMDFDIFYVVVFKLSSDVASSVPIE